MRARGEEARRPAEEGLLLTGRPVEAERFETGAVKPLMRER